MNRQEAIAYVVGLAESVALEFCISAAEAEVEADEARAALLALGCSAEELDAPCREVPRG